MGLASHSNQPLWCSALLFSPLLGTGSPAQVRHHTLPYGILEMVLSSALP